MSLAKYELWLRGELGLEKALCQYQIKVVRRDVMIHVFPIAPSLIVAMGADFEIRGIFDFEEL